MSLNHRCSSPSDPVLTLPVDVLVSIFKYLKFREVVRCLRVSKAWHTQLSLVPTLWEHLEFIGSSAPRNSCVSGALRRAGPLLRSLSLLDAHYLNGGSLAILCRIPRPHWTSLSLVTCRQLGVDSLVRAIQSHGHALTRLQLNDAPLDDDSVRAILSACPRLTYLDISDNTGLSRYMFQGIQPTPTVVKKQKSSVNAPTRSSYPPLEHFIFRSNQECASSGIWIALCNQYSATLRELNWSGTGTVTGMMLHHLTLCENLQSLNLNWCTLSGDEADITHAFVLLGERCRQLEKVSLGNLTNITEMQISGLLSTTTELSYLDLTNAHEVTDRFLRTLSVRVPLLTHLQLGGCFQCTDVGVSHILKRCPGLRSLSLSKTAVTDIVLLRLVRYTKQLHTLVLDCCSGITNAGISSLVAHPEFVGRLRTLSMMNCIKIDYDMASRIKELLHPKAELLYYFNG
ncbi:hypothetical protein IWQ62_002939 [Dispira parvispora]|uniref:F-box domain-containing protein n=1 Tax=Dispira parvispora TaxID=1520584 RepID=A0A9W8E6Q4_9FUNG|nr:hypothetical protein IWQ62_002939 [Dispira parvispora]